MFLPVKFAAVVADGRHYEYVVALRAVGTLDFMAARRGLLPDELIEKISNRVINETECNSRVTYDVYPKSPATIEWE